ncbi:YheC/YheD family protein [Cohnella pontilimi]|uniref:YheC/YheD family protein n=1 Tax=Cohnella pontilimi TaxID=2564100 RepID=A0A4U0FBW8_9BACL|nr:YheC/YheD family protein [Cohnella pontilimi]TJY41694.1 YheC/YheD family protein [Cohnella pontilimi]
MSIQLVGSKWAKTEVLRSAPDLKPFLPETCPYNRESVNAMLDRFGMIYVKPDNGTFGKGVIRVTKRNGINLMYVFQSGTRQYRFESFDEMFRELEKVKLPKPYLVQQGIELLKHRGRRFDLRVMVQKTPRSRWLSSGVIGRLAHPRKIVTNYHNGGTLMPVEKLLAGWLAARDMKRFLSFLRKLGTGCAVAMETKFPGIKEIGLDVAVDGQGKPWILEVNTKPDPYIFRKLPDRSIFRRIYRFAAAYGRVGYKRRRR